LTTCGGGGKGAGYVPLPVEVDEEDVEEVVVPDEVVELVVAPVPVVVPPPVLGDPPVPRAPVPVWWVVPPPLPAPEEKSFPLLLPHAAVRAAAPRPRTKSLAGRKSIVEPPP
jgi:hypothetical protein